MDNKYSHTFDLGIRIKQDQDEYFTEDRLTTSRFGYKENSLENIEMRQCVRSMHTHNGSEQNSFEYYINILKYLIKLKNNYFPNTKYINLGGGLHSLTNEAIEELAIKLTPLAKEYEIAILFEPGRYLYRGSGLAIGKILGIKKETNKHYSLVTDLSSECHLKWSTPRLIGSVGYVFTQKQKRIGEITVTIRGPTCYENDIIGEYKTFLTADGFPFQLNDLILFGGINGYSAAWTTEFNGIPKAIVKTQYV
jgi:diaminopimelate decarboxylase